MVFLWCILCTSCATARDREQEIRKESMKKKQSIYFPKRINVIILRNNDPNYIFNTKNDLNYKK